MKTPIFFALAVLFTSLTAPAFAGPAPQSCPKGYFPYNGGTCVSNPHGPYKTRSVIFPDGTRSNTCYVMGGRIGC